MQEQLAFEVTMQCKLEEAIGIVTEALKSEGFGILTRIDVKETFEKKLDIDFHPYVILGACNPNLAHAALSVDSNVGLMLPCNVTVEEDDTGASRIRLLNPAIISQFVDYHSQEKLKDTAELGRQKIMKVASQLQNRHQVDA